MADAAIQAPTLLALGAAFCFALALILTQYGLRTVPSCRSPIYTIGSSMIAAWLGALLFVDWRGFDWRAVLIFAGIGCVFPVVVSILSVRSNERLGPAVAGAAGNVTPLFAVLFAVLLLGERIGLGQVAGLLLVVAGVAQMALRGGAGGRRWSVWVLALPLAAALVRGAIQPAIKSALAIWHEPLVAAAIGYSLSTVVILSLVGRRALAAARPHRPAMVHRRWHVQRDGDLSSLCRARPGLDHRGGATGRHLPADRRGAELFPAARREAARDSACWASSSVSPVSFCCWWEPDGGEKAAE